MRFLLIYIFLTWSKIILGQNDSLMFDNHIKLKEGVYTSFAEVLENSPKYHDCLFETKVDFWFGKMKIYYYDKLGIKNEFIDTILLVVQDGKRYVKYKNRFCKLILTGAISTFFIESIYNDYSTGNMDTDYKLFFIDLKTGTIDKLNPPNIDNIFKRNNLLYSEYSLLSNTKKKKTLYSFILKFNMQNPIYVKVK
jgi:hypothetical protein